jgi:hypothetical protein
MRIWLSIGLAAVALICGLGSAYFWERTAHVRPEPTGFEPVVPELKRGWWQLAEWDAAERSAKLNWKAARLAAAAATFAFASAVVSLLPNSD